MVVTYIFKDTKTADTVAKALLFVAKFSKKQALVKFSDSSVSVLWGGSPKSYFIHTEATALDMFKNRHLNITGGIDHMTIVQVEPLALGKILKGNSHERNVSIAIMRATNQCPARIEVKVEHTVESSKRVINHKLPCEVKRKEDYNSMLIDEVERNYCRYDTISYINNICQFKIMVEGPVKMNQQGILINSKENAQCNELSLVTRTQGATIIVTIEDLENGYAGYIRDEEEYTRNEGRRKDAGVYIDAKKLASFLSSLHSYDAKTKICAQIEHNKCLKLSLDNEEIRGEKFHQSILLLHSLSH